MNDPDGSEVKVLSWPAEAVEARLLAARGVPRLLLVSGQGLPPFEDDPLQEWVRVPASEREVVARVLALLRRAAGQAPPLVDSDDRLVFGGNWVALSPIEARLASSLARRFGEVVTEEELLRCGWPSERPTQGPSNGALRVHLSRLRRRISSLGLEIRAIRGKGLVLRLGDRGTPGASALVTP